MDAQSDPLERRSQIDWERIARDFGAFTADEGEFSSSYLAQRALDQIVGTAEWRAAVDHYVADRPGGQLARSVMWLVHPWPAMQRCHEIFCSDDDPENRSTAVELLRVVADRRALPWIEQYLDDANSGVQTCAAGIVDQLLWSNLVEPEECIELLKKMSGHSNPEVQETYKWICSFLSKREEPKTEDCPES
jgi:hypothetical protein